MDTLLTFLLSNALCAVVLAVPALAVGRLGRRPALAHALWLLVLLKLLTPPLFVVPLPRLAEPVQPEPLPPVPSSVPERVEVVVGETQESDESEPIAVFEPPSEPVPVATAAGSPWWPWLLGGVWLTGSGLWLGLLLVRVSRFRRALEHAAPAPPDLQRQAATLARRLGLSWCPAVLLVPGRLSPLIWGLGSRPCLLVPSALWKTLAAEQQDTLLLHELAHVRRGDHLVRLLEVVVTALYWWHPVVWLAQRELREAEEACCDAWVVWVAPGSARAYATALVECLDFLSGVEALDPVCASGVSRVSDLKRRLTMILKGTAPRRLTLAGGLMVMAALLLLPAMPTWADDRPSPGRDRPGSGDAAQARAEVEKLRAQLEEQLARARDTERKLREAVQRLDQAEGQGAKREVEIIIRRSEGSNRPGTVPGRPAEGGRPGVPAEPRPVTPPQGHVVRPPVVPQPPQPPQSTPRGGDRRLEELERKLDAVLRELEEVRRQLPRNPRPGTTPPSSR